MKRVWGAIALISLAACKSDKPAGGVSAAMLAAPPCWTTARPPIVLSTNAAGPCTGVLAVEAGFLFPLELAAEWARKGASTAGAHGPGVFGVRPVSAALDARYPGLVLAEGTLESGVLTSARISGLSFDRAIEQAPEVRELIARTTGFITQLPPPEHSMRFEELLPFVALPDEQGLRALLARFDRSRYAISALVLAAHRRPELVRAHAGEIRAALDAKPLDYDRAEIECAVFDECIAARKAAFERFEKGELPSSKAGTPADRLGKSYTAPNWAFALAWARHAIEWLALRPTWGDAERAVYEHYVSFALAWKYPYGPIARAQYGAPKTKPASWPAPGEVDRDPTTAEWKAITSAQGWAHSGELAILVAPIRRYINAMPPAEVPAAGALHVPVSVVIVNFGRSPVKVAPVSAKLAVAAVDVELGPEATIEVAPRSEALWQGAIAGGTLSVKTKSSIEISMRAGDATVSASAPFDFSVAQ